MDQQHVETTIGANTESSLKNNGKLNWNPVTKLIEDVLHTIKTVNYNFLGVRSCAIIMGFNETQAVNEYLSNYGMLVQVDLNKMITIVEAFENILSLPLFTLEETLHVLDVFNRFISFTEQFEIKEGSFKLVTNR